MYVRYGLDRPHPRGRPDERRSDGPRVRGTEDRRRAGPGWDEYPGEAPGENVRIEDEILIWERDGFEVRLETYRTTHWRAEVDIPEAVAKWYPREIDLKIKPPKQGFVESVTTESYHAEQAELIVSAPYQPVYEVNSWIDELLESAEGSEEYQQEIEEKMAVARDHED